MIIMFFIIGESEQDWIDEDIHLNVSMEESLEYYEHEYAYALKNNDTYKYQEFQLKYLIKYKTDKILKDHCE